MLLGPITPFLTDHVWRQLYSKDSIHLQRFPRALWSKAHRRHTEKMLAFNRDVWRIKEEKDLALRDPLEMEVPKALAPFRKDLIKMHSLIMNQ